MPIYEYKCGKCGRISEFLKSSASSEHSRTASGELSRTSNADRKKCTHCGSEKLEKQFSMFSARVADGPSKKCHSCSDHKCPHAGGSTGSPY